MSNHKIESIPWIVSVGQSTALVPLHKIGWEQWKD